MRPCQAVESLGVGGGTEGGRGKASPDPLQRSSTCDRVGNVSPHRCASKITPRFTSYGSESGDAPIAKTVLHKSADA